VTGRELIGAGGFQHVAMLYASPDEFAAGMMDVVRTGLSGGALVFVAATGPNLQLLRGQLDGQSALVAWAGLPSAGTNPRRITAAIRSFAADHPGQVVWYVQEPAWHRRARDELCEAIRREALINLALAGSPVTVLCGYDSPLGDRELATVERTHAMLVRGRHWQSSQAYTTGTAIPGECDLPLSAVPASAAGLAYRDNQAEIRRFAAEHGRRAGLRPDRARDLVLAVGELAGNTLVHTGKPGTLAIWTGNGEIICQVQDTGHITDPLAGTRRPGPTDSGGGRGLWLVNQLCDLVEIRTGPGGTTIRLRIRLGS